MLLCPWTKYGLSRWVHIHPQSDEANTWASGLYAGHLYTGHPKDRILLVSEIGALLELSLCFDYVWTFCDDLIMNYLDDIATLIMYLLIVYLLVYFFSKF